MGRGSSTENSSCINWVGRRALERIMPEPSELLDLWQDFDDLSHGNGTYKISKTDLGIKTEI